ncbi:16297_t:CDS:2 [Dentiscutata heterogama]|uniref:16297_t:CDS:1 n=1 Tax=Dentiscutata heterogama TaxID=1316150 RepID=A0ACA9KE74_9GLOM|nr:16297_t:CDS:2 [Dentiscutata heterogama]
MDASQPLNSSINEPTESMIEAAKNDYANRLYVHTQQQLIRAKSKQHHQKPKRREKNPINVSTTSFITQPMVCCSPKLRKSEVEDIDKNGGLSSSGFSN